MFKPYFCYPKAPRSRSAPAFVPNSLKTEAPSGRVDPKRDASNTQIERNILGGMLFRYKRKVEMTVASVQSSIRGGPRLSGRKGWYKVETLRDIEDYSARMSKLATRANETIGVAHISINTSREIAEKLRRNGQFLVRKTFAFDSSNRSSSSGSSRKCGFCGSNDGHNSRTCVAKQLWLAKERKLKRRCGNCGSSSGHNARTCPHPPARFQKKCQKVPSPDLTLAHPARGAKEKRSTAAAVETVSRSSEPGSKARAAMAVTAEKCPQNSRPKKRKRHEQNSKASGDSRTNMNTLKGGSQKNSNKKKQRVCFMVKKGFRSVCDGTCRKYGSVEIYQASNILISLADTTQQQHSSPSAAAMPTPFHVRMVAQGA